ncbi:Arc family DNA-binding protein [Pectobacterium brasiliense]|uniref:Arc family DNA-binding protein n=1 Tax=Pectobacterium brasiliense TaxID=180957 RepID=UPI001F0771FC|nr:Arc family DNA-binding protein [Pectobacterium brasiliense]
MSKYPSQMQDKFNLRFPDGMRDAIAERAKANGRSMNSEIVQILEDALNDKVGVDAVAMLMSKLSNWYTGMAPVLEKVKHMDDEQLREFVEQIEKKKPT